MPTIKNLETAHHKITTFSNTAKRTQKQRRFSKHLLTQIDKIETKINRWYEQNGLISQYQQKSTLFPYRETLPPTTKDFITEVQTTRQAREAYVTQELAPLIIEVNEKVTSLKKAKEKEQANSLKGKNAKVNLFVDNDYLNHLEAILDDLEALPQSIKQSEWWTPEKYNDAYMRDYARILGATVKPYAQAIDPLYGKSEGFCGGLSYEWARLVAEEKNKVRISNLNITRAVGKIQNNQPTKISYHWQTLKDKKHFEKLYLIISTLANIEKEQSYLLCFSNHLIGIRYLPKCSLVEIFEPNFGHIIFPNEFRAAEWLHELLQIELYKDELTNIVLIAQAKQPADSEPSIPFNILSANTLPFIQTYLRKDLNETNLFRSWMQRSLLNAFQNKLEGEKQAKGICEAKLKDQLAHLSSIARMFYEVKNPKDLKYRADDSLKDKVIGRLEEKISTRYDPSRFDGLIKKVKSSPPYITLSTVIQDWLGDNNQNTNQANAFELSCFDYDILDESILENEISHYQLALHRTDALYTFLLKLNLVVKIFNYTQSEITPFIKKLVDISFNAFEEGVSFDHLWQQIIDCAKAAAANNPLTCFTEFTNNQFDYQLAQDIAKVDFDSPESLRLFKKVVTLFANEFEACLGSKLDKIQALTKASTLLPDHSLDSFSLLYDEVKSKNLKFELSIKSLHQLYQLFPYALLAEKAQPYQDSYLDLVKKIASEAFCGVQNGMKLFTPGSSKLYARIQSASSLKTLACDLKNKGTKFEFTKTSPMRALCNLIQCLSVYEDDKNPRGHCLIDSFAARYGLSQVCKVEDKLALLMRLSSASIDLNGADALIPHV